MFQPTPATIMDTFKGPAMPDDEEARLQTVQMLVPTTDDDPVLASLCKLVCSLLKVPAAGACMGAHPMAALPHPRSGDCDTCRRRHQHSLCAAALCSAVHAAHACRAASVSSAGCPEPGACRCAEGTRLRCVARTHVCHPCLEGGRELHRSRKFTAPRPRRLTLHTLDPLLLGHVPGTPWDGRASPTRRDGHLGQSRQPHPA